MQSWTDHLMDGGRESKYHLPQAGLNHTGLNALTLAAEISIRRSMVSEPVVR